MSNSAKMVRGFGVLGFWGLTYIAALLHAGLQLPGEHLLRLHKKIDEHETSWALGIGISPLPGSSNGMLSSITSAETMRVISVQTGSCAPQANEVFAAGDPLSPAQRRAGPRVALSPARARRRRSGDRPAAYPPPSKSAPRARRSYRRWNSRRQRSSRAPQAVFRGPRSCGTSASGSA